MSGTILLRSILLGISVLLLAIFYVPNCGISETEEEIVETLNSEDANRLAACVAYVGYLPENGEKTLEEVIQESEMQSRYPELLEEASKRVAYMPGCDIYMIVPEADVNRTIVKEIDLIAYDWSEEVAIANGKVVLEGGNEPFLVICNISDIMPNISIEMERSDEKTVFSPYISLQDGSVTVMGGQERIAILH